MKKLRKQFFKLVYHRFPRQKINLFIVGEQKCGTSSLHTMLTQHESISGGKRKELHYFDYWKHEGTSFKEYERWFAYDGRKKRPEYFLDATPSYAFSGSALLHLHTYNPAAKLIYLTRNPVERFFSAYAFYTSKLKRDRRNPEIDAFLKNHRDLSIEQFFEVETGENPVFQALKRGDYPDMINRITALFPSEQLFVTSLEAIADEASSPMVLNDLGAFLELDLSGLAFPKRGVSQRNELKVPQQITDYLTRYYKDSVVF